MSVHLCVCVCGQQLVISTFRRHLLWIIGVEARRRGAPLLCWLGRRRPCTCIDDASIVLHKLQTSTRSRPDGRLCRYSSRCRRHATSRCYGILTSSLASCEKWYHRAIGLAASAAGTPLMSADNCVYAPVLYGRFNGLLVFMEVFVERRTPGSHIVSIECGEGHRWWLAVISGKG